MKNPLKRMKTLWNLSKLPEDVLQKAEDLEEAIASHADEGDGGAVFFSEGTEDEYDQHIRDSSGWSKFYKKLKEL